MMKMMWCFSTNSTHTKLIEKDLTKMSTFHTKSQILHVNYPCTISNKDLIERCRTESMATNLMKR